LYAPPLHSTFHCALAIHRQGTLLQQQIVTQTVLLARAWKRKISVNFCVGFVSLKGMGGGINLYYRETFIITFVVHID